MIFRVIFFILVYVPFMLIFCPLQWLWLKLGLPNWNAIPMIFHRLGAAFIGMKVTVIGKPVEGQPVLIVSNHISWTDIIAIGSVAPVTFVAKQEVAKWFFVGFMANLQRTLYVD
ncbi:MAG TPA: 1-acyl-sn-glycerol-3-phosphate acyltransferase, partial [Devosia sp.]